MTEPPAIKITRVPDTYLILVGVALVAFAMTYLITPGSFQVHEQMQPSGEVHLVLDPESFSSAASGPQGLPLFASGGKTGLLNLPFEGMVSGDKWGAAIGVFAFILITGGAFGIVMDTGAIHHGLLRLIAKSHKLDILAIPILFTAFSLGGAVFGMGEEVIPFVLIVVPVFTAIGYDSITSMLVTYVATQIGFACSWMNPFSVSIAQGIAEVPLLSGADFRITLWMTFTILGILFTLNYAKGIKRNPKTSLVYVGDNNIHRATGFDHDRFDHDNHLSTSHLSTSYPNTNNTTSALPLTRGEILIFLTLILSMLWMIWGVTTQAYYLPEIASQFFTMGVVAAIIGCVFKLQGMTGNSAVESFRRGAAQLLPAALVVAFAKGIVLVLGGDGPTNISVLNTILHHTAQALAGLPETVAACAMFLFQSVFNFFLTSGSGQAALTMPIMAPLADLVGVSRQVAVLAFQLGDGLTNLLVPTSAALMGCLGAARVDWGTWVKFIATPLLILFLLSTATMILAVLINYN